MRSLVTALLLLIFSLSRAQSPDAVNAYVNRYKSIAIEEMKLYGIPASVTLAQGIHESGCGRSPLALNSNNHFGIKCHDEWSGQTYHHDDDLPQECFRVYNCPEESFRDHSEFLKTRPRYASLFSLNAGDYRAWAKGLKAAGYATNPKYSEIIIKLIEDYNLSQFDKENGQVILAKTEPKINSDSLEVQHIKQQMFPATSPSAAVSEPKLNAPSLTLPDNSAISYEERIVNATTAVIYRKGLSLVQLAEKYHISLQQLYQYNDMTPKDKFKDNDLVFVEPKKPESNYYQYEVSEGETMRDIAQKFAIQLSELIQRNGISTGCEPIPGEIIVLRGKREVPLKFRVTGKNYSSRSDADITAPVPADNRIHKVETSETLYSISRAYNIPLDTLKRINGLKDEDIKIGQTLILQL